MRYLIFVLLILPEVLFFVFSGLFGIVYISVLVLGIAYTYNSNIKLIFKLLMFPVLISLYFLTPFILSVFFTEYTGVIINGVVPENTLGDRFGRVSGLLTLKFILLVIVASFLFVREVISRHLSDTRGAKKQKGN